MTQNQQETIKHEEISVDYYSNKFSIGEKVEISKEEEIMQMQKESPSWKHSNEEIQKEAYWKITEKFEEIENRLNIVHHHDSISKIFKTTISKDGQPDKIKYTMKGYPVTAVRSPDKLNKEDQKVVKKEITSREYEEIKEIILDYKKISEEISQEEQQIEIG